MQFLADCFWDSTQCTNKITSSSSTTRQYCTKRFKICIDAYLSKVVYHSKKTYSTAQTALITNEGIISPMEARKLSTMFPENTEKYSSVQSTITEFTSFLGN